ncbi:VG15 protein [Micromonospora chersina]
MGVLEVAARHARRQVALARQAAREMARLWARVDRQAIGPSWAASVPAAVQVLGSAQAIAAASAAVYLDDLLDEYGLAGGAEGRVVPDALAGVASDGRDLAGLLYQPAIVTLTSLKQGATEGRALAGGRFALDMIVRSQVADAGRVADGVALAVRPQLSGYVRMVVGGTCARCLVLAGRFYRWNAGFQRHPRCDCRHIPASEDAAGDLRTDPKAAFEAMSEAEQDRVFGAAGAQAIREGADMARVVNARRGMQVVGQRKFTTEAAGRRPRLMPEQIYRDAKDRDDAVRLLRLHGYIT